MRSLLLKRALLFVFIFFSLACSAQNFISASYGIYKPDLIALDDYFRQLSTDKTFPDNRGIGINCDFILETNAGRSFDGALGYEYLLPQTISRGDSVHFTMQGWHLTSSLWGLHLIFSNPYFDAVIAPGADWGVMKIKKGAPEGSMIYKDPFIAPLLRFEFRLKLGRIVLGARTFYRYDITKADWKYRGNPSSLPKTKFSGLGFQVFLGFTEKPKLQ